MITNTIPVVEPGRALRAPNFHVVATRAAAFIDIAARYRDTDRELPTVSEMRTLIARGGRHLEFVDRHGRQRQLTATHIQLWEIFLSRTSNEKWRNGRPVVWPGNHLLASELLCTPRHVANLISDLEAAGALIREYTFRNRRHGAGGIDLAPTYALLPEIRACIEAAEMKLAEARSQLDAKDSRGYQGISCHHEIKTTLDYKTEAPSSSKEDCTTEPPPVENVDEVDRAEGGKPPRSIHIGRSAPDSVSLRDVCLQDEWRLDLANISHPAIITLLTKTSSAFRWTLKTAFKVPDPMKVSHAEILELIAYLKDKRFSDLRPGLWKWALQAHGINAVLAMFLALEKDGITNRTGYLAGILKKSPRDSRMNPAEGLRREAIQSAEQAKRDGQFH